MRVGPILVGMRRADAERDPRPRIGLEFLADRRERCFGQTQVRLGRRQRHGHRRHQRAQPVDRLVVKMAIVDAGIGDEEFLRAEPEPDALGDAGEPGGQRRANGAVENPDRAELPPPQQRHEPDQIDAAAQFRAGVLEINRFGNAWLAGQQLLGAARRRREKRHAPARRRRRDGADERQVPDDVADTGLGLDDRRLLAASGVTLIAAPKVAICGFNAQQPMRPMRTDLFDFTLPEDRIALRPAAPRDAARLLVVRPSRGSGAPAELEDRRLRDLPALLRPGDALVVNDTKVLAANLHGRRLGRGDREPAIDATLIKRLDGSRWRALVKPAKRLKAGDVVRFGGEGRVCFLEQLDATVEDKGEGGEGGQGGEVTLEFAFHGAVLDQALADRGEVPLPPYISSRRAADERDRADYQTMFAREDGAVAAPTAGLHFTEALVAALRARGVDLQRVTLHVGPGTFLPVKADDTSGHHMHARMGQRIRRNRRGARMPRAAPAAASSPSARRRCGCWKARPPTTARSRRLPARPPCSSRPATVSARSTRC